VDGGSLSQLERSKGDGMEPTVYVIAEKCEHGNETNACPKCIEAISALEVDSRGIKHANEWEGLISRVSHGGMNWQD